MLINIYADVLTAITGIAVVSNFRNVLAVVMTVLNFTTSTPLEEEFD